MRVVPVILAAALLLTGACDTPPPEKPAPRPAAT
jgi:hypothetical protein